MNDENFWVKGGTAQPFVKITQSLQHEIPLPPLAEQERLVRLLDEADALRRLRARADERMADFIPALFHEMFGDPTRNKNGWPIIKIEQLFPADRPGVKCGPFGSALKKHEHVDSGVPVWGIDTVTPNHFIESGSRFITKTKYAELMGYSVEAGDILISRAGTVGRMCVAYPTQSPSIIGTNLIRLVLNPNEIVPEYLTSLFTHFPTIASLRANADEGAYSFMNTKVLRSLKIPLPPLNIQRGFAARVAEAGALEEKQGQSAARLEALFESMLARAFAGEL